MQTLLIFPFSGTGVEALDCLGDTWSCIGFVSDDPARIGTSFNGIPIFSRAAFYQYPEAHVLAVHGSAHSFAQRDVIIQQLNIDHTRFATVIHPHASVSAFAQLGRNVLIMAGAVVTATAIVEDHVLLLPHAVVHHDARVGAFSILAAHAVVTGNVQIGKSCYIGASATIKNGVALADQTLVGMGANVLHSYESPHVLIGNPAKPMSSIKANPI